MPERRRRAGGRAEGYLQSRRPDRSARFGRAIGGGHGARGQNGQGPPPGQLILRKSTQIVRSIPGLIIARHRLGVVLATGSGRVLDSPNLASQSERRGSGSRRRAGAGRQRRRKPGRRKWPGRVRRRERGRSHHRWRGCATRPERRRQRVWEARPTVCIGPTVYEDPSLRAPGPRPDARSRGLWCMGTNQWRVLRSVLQQRRQVRRL